MINREDRDPEPAADLDASQAAEVARDLVIGEEPLVDSHSSTTQKSFICRTPCLTRSSLRIVSSG